MLTDLGQVKPILLRYITYIACYMGNDVTAWKLLFHLERKILAKQSRTGQSNSLSSIIKKGATDYSLLTPDMFNILMSCYLN